MFPETFSHILYSLSLQTSDQTAIFLQIKYCLAGKITFRIIQKEGDIEIDKKNRKDITDKHIFLGYFD